MGTAALRDEVNRLYDSASELVEAARDVRDAAIVSESSEGHPAVLACVEEALDELWQAARAMRPGPEGRTPGAAGAARDARVDRGLRNLEVALADAATAAAAARGLTARVQSRTS